MAATAQPPSLGRRLAGSDYLVALLCGGWVLVAAPFTPGLLAPGNLANILASLLPLLVLATGQTLVLVAGGIDLSVTAIIGLAGVVGAFAMSATGGWLAGHPLAPLAGAALTLATGAAVGACNGLAIGAGRMPAFMVTLTAMMFFSGLAIWLTQSRPIDGLPAAFTAVGSRLPLAALLTAGVVVTAWALLQRTLFGRWLFALGHNPRAATIAGVPVARVQVGLYIASGLCAACAAILYTGRLEAASPVTGQRVLLDVIGATVIGGTSLYGGRGRIGGTVFGALFLTLIDNTLNLLNLSHFAIMMAKGGVILLAAALDAARHRSPAA
jgi:ribose/xylose/arabinose/galactoside ABC-type transport system permease subunit